MIVLAAEFLPGAQVATANRRQNSLELVAARFVCAAARRLNQSIIDYSQRFAFRPDLGVELSVREIHELRDVIRSTGFHSGTKGRLAHPAERLAQNDRPGSDPINVKVA